MYNHRQIDVNVATQPISLLTQKIMHCMQMSQSLGFQALNQSKRFKVGESNYKNGELYHVNMMEN